LSTYGVKLQRSDDLKLAARSDAPTASSLVDWARRRRETGERLAVDLFSGAGGLSLGLEAAGWTVAAAVDHDSKALATHAHNFDGLTLRADLADAKVARSLIRLLKPVEPDLVAGGPPCQPFSRAGRSKIKSLVRDGLREAIDDRRQLWRPFVETAISLKPRVILMENVPDMALGDGFSVVREIVERMERAGYHTQIRLVDAWLYGVPQHRKRLIVLARNDCDEFFWPAIEPKVYLGDAIGDLPPLKDTIGARLAQYSPEGELGPFATLMRNGSEDGIVHDHMTRPVREDDRVIFEMMDSKTLYSSIPAHLRRYSADTFDDKYKRLGKDDLSRSVTAHIARDGYWYIHHAEHRTLTVREAARIQTFPDRFRFAGTRSDAYRQIGNAVPPLLGAAAAKALLPREEAAVTPEKSGVRPVIDRGHWHQARLALSAWGRKVHNGPDHWYLVPGKRTTPQIAAVAVSFGRRASRIALSLILTAQRNGAPLDEATIRELQNGVGSSGPAAVVLDQLPSLISEPSLWLDSGEIITRLKLRKSEADLFRLLNGEDLMLDGQAGFRVAARVAGTQTDTKNRLTDGRIDLARLVGAGPGAPLRMASIRLIGANLCRAENPACGLCPLQKWCASAQSLASS
jgi:DNA (cytosine-5)-methyltransferase 1